MQLELTHISHTVGTTLIYQRAVDGYVNATAMCKASGKDFFGYRRNATTQEFLEELSSVTGIPVDELVISVVIGPMDLRGTWVHPDVAINLGQWCSPKFAVAVSQWVREWISGKSKPAGLPYHVQRYLVNSSAIPKDHFSMLNEMLFALIAPLENEGYTMPEGMIPDISTGKTFCKWLRDVKGIDTDSLPTYIHRYEDGRAYPAKLYPNSVLADFRKYFYETWLPQKAEKYFLKRDPEALKHLPKLMPLPAPQATVPKKLK